MKYSFDSYDLLEVAAAAMLGLLAAVVVYLLC